MESKNNTSDINRMDIDILTGEVIEKNNIDSVVNFVDSAEKIMDELTLTFDKTETGYKEDNAEDTVNEKSAARKLFFLPRKWKFNPEYKNGFGERTIITDMFGKLSEAFCISKWCGNRGEYWTEIQSEHLALEKNTEYVFTFWLNGGENDRYRETCRLKIIFDNDDKNCYMYKLNRDIIKPVKRYKGWVLFEIPFTTELNDYTQLKFEAADAHTAILPALGKEAYENLPDEEIDPRIPQRHNIIFKDGFPRNSSWSYLVFGDENSNENNNANNSNGFNHNDFTSKMNRFGQKMNDFGQKFNEKFNGSTGFSNDMADKFNHFRENIFKDTFEDMMDDIEDEIKDEIMDELKDELKESVKSQVVDEILARFRK